MRDLVRPLLLIGVLLAIIVGPFLLVGDLIETWYARLRAEPPSRPVTAAIVVGTLTTDIFLPVPSSAISTLGGWQLGVVGGTLASWIGMTASAALGFALASRWGEQFARLFSKTEDIQRMRATSDRYGPAFLMIMRGVPVLAEASVLLVGIHRLPWRRFLPPILASNFALSFVYSAFGEFSASHEWLPLAIGVSIGFPVLLAVIVRRYVGTVKGA